MNSLSGYTTVTNAITFARIILSLLLLLGRIAVLRTYMWPIDTDQEAWSVCLSVGRLVYLSQ